ncbi:MAG: hypothetical protein CM1200mP36_00220 [Gammaproteobacteria bacterium]|nr:MAG: hypothetical protein CM1200mP36_00220 [Gammaproteobacteria bacterium]
MITVPSDLEARSDPIERNYVDFAGQNRVIVRPASTNLLRLAKRYDYRSMPELRPLQDLRYKGP